MDRHNIREMLKKAKTPEEYMKIRKKYCIYKPNLWA
jgi:hypothetical protein